MPGRGAAVSDEHGAGASRGEGERLLDRLDVVLQTHGAPVRVLRLKARQGEGERRDTRFVQVGDDVVPRPSPEPKARNQDDVGGHRGVAGAHSRQRAVSAGPTPRRDRPKRECFRADTFRVLHPLGLGY